MVTLTSFHERFTETCRHLSLGADWILLGNRFDHDVFDAARRALVESPEQNPERASTVAAHKRLHPREHPLTNEDLSSAAIADLQGCHHVMGIAERLPENRLFNRHWLPSHVRAHQNLSLLQERPPV